LFQRALESSHDLRIVYADLGAIYMQQKKYKEAQPALLRAVKLDPARPDAHYQLSRLYQALGKNAEAANELRKVRELHEKADESLAGKMPSALSISSPPNDK